MIVTAPHDTQPRKPVSVTYRTGSVSALGSAVSPKSQLSVAYRTGWLGMEDSNQQMSF
jgi:hypothetical protein